jgi:hypothetical protein
MLNPKTHLSTKTGYPHPPQPDTPEQMRLNFGKQVFRLWNNINENVLVRKANQINADRLGREYALWYLLAKQNIKPASTLKRASHWFGIRNKKLIAANSSLVEKKAVSANYNSIYPKSRKPVPVTPRRMTMRYLSKEKQLLEGLGKDWEAHKKMTLKTHKKVSNENYLRFRNGEKNILNRKFNPKTDAF